MERIIKLGAWIGGGRLIRLACRVQEWQYEVAGVLGLALATNILAAKLVGDGARGGFLNWLLL